MTEKTKLLDSQAVARQADENAGHLLRAYTATPDLQMVHSHTPAMAKEQKPKGTAAGDHLIDP